MSDKINKNIEAKIIDKEGQKMEKLFGYEINKSFDYENGYYITSNINRLGKSLAQYELYKSIIGLPGDVLEFGVFKGASIIRLATFREVLESQYSRKIIGFDMFEEFPRQGIKEDDDFIMEFEEEAGHGIEVEELEKIFEHKGFLNMELVKGDIIETLPEYLYKNNHLKIALLHIDVDVYKPTLCVLEALFDKVVKGGIIMLDDYSKVSGANKAVDEFLEGKNYHIQKLPYSHIPVYIQK